jgi:uncharacterized membrane protein
VSEQRLPALDVMRGLVMVLMSIDHASATFNGGRLVTDSLFMWQPGDALPTDQFFTRWITHLCAPTFVLLAGAVLAISTERRLRAGHSARAVDAHLRTRGLVLLALEVLWMSPAMVGPGHVLLQVLFAIGGALLAMSWLRRLSDRALLAIALALLVGGEALAGLLAALDLVQSLPAALLLTGGFFLDGGFVVAYPLLPWLAIMLLGWVLGRRLLAWRERGLDVPRRAAAVLAAWGAGGLLVFLVVRGLDGYGNMLLHRDDGSLAHWLHVSKYPPSLGFAALELGLAALLLAALLRLGAVRPGFARPLATIGQVALFFYVLHVHLMELVALAFGWRGAFGLGSAYLGAAAVLLALYPACVRYRAYKAAHPDGWTQYL